MKLIVKHRQLYGHNYFYPVNDMALTLLRLINTADKRKCFTLEQVNLARELGFVVEIQPITFD